MNEQPIQIGMKAPDFQATTTLGPVKMSDFAGQWVVFFSHPGDFTPVCTTEFIAFTMYYEKFASINTALLGLSIDSNPSHLAWVNEIQKISDVVIPFPIIADRDSKIAQEYNMIAPNVSTQETVRNVFIIDPNQIIRAILIYPLTNGRNIPEIFRLVYALQTTDAYHVVTPANWTPGSPALVPPPRTYADMMERENDPESLGLDCKDWFLCYKDFME